MRTGPTITVTIPARPLRKWRPAFVIALGCRLHPASVTEAWYAQDCPPKLDGGVSPVDLLRWRVACALRGC